jgi:hypothetical protein
MMFGLSRDETLVRIAVILALKKLSLKMDGESELISVPQGYNRIQKALNELHTLITTQQPTRKDLLVKAANISAEAIRFTVDLVLSKNEDKDIP